MNESLEREINSEMERHHHESCASKENAEFENRVQIRAYAIYKSTRRDDSKANYYQAKNELRRELCDCEEVRRSMRADRTRTGAAPEESRGQTERTVPETRTEETQRTGPTTRTEETQRTVPTTRTEETQRTGPTTRTEETHRTGPTTRTEEPQRTAQTRETRTEERRTEGRGTEHAERGHEETRRTGVTQHKGQKPSEEEEIN